MAEYCSSSYFSIARKKKTQVLINGCIVKGVREKITSCEEYKKIELEELEAYLDPSFSPERELDKEPSLCLCPTKSLDSMPL